MDVFEKVKTLLGLKKNTEYERKYFEDINTKSSLYMSVTIALLEVWMIVRTIIITLERSMNTEWIVSHLISYVVLFIAAASVFVYAVVYLKKGVSNKWVGSFLRVVFSIICIGFGIYISQKDYVKGEQILTFVTMVVFVACMFSWRPVVSFIVLTIIFSFFYILMDNTFSLTFLPESMTPVANASAATQINFFILWISVFMVSLSVYFQRLEDARKDESLENMNEYLRKLAMTEELTKLSNKPYFISCAASMLEDREISGYELTFLYMNISNFKGYNVKYGFDRGNKLLKDTALKIKELFPHDICARFSDDHFVILVKGSGYLQTIEKLRDFIVQSDNEVRLGLKVGAYHPREGDMDPEIACDNARYACGTLKKVITNKDYCEYDEELAGEMRKTQYIVNNIDKAVENGWIVPYYQPVIWSESCEICGAEALARWIDPEYGFLPPSAFIPILEEYRQIHKVDTAIVEKVCAGIRRNMDMGKTAVPISINFSRLDFILMDVFQVLEDAVKKHNIDRRLLHVEVTESALVEEHELLQNTLYKLKDAGYSIWLDDFGSGYSSLNVLKDYDFDVVKLDMKFLSGFGENSKAGVIIDSILKMAEKIGMRTLSEGVETEEEAEFLRNAGCERLQGYLIGKPMPAEELNQNILEKTYTVSEDVLI